MSDPGERHFEQASALLADAESGQAVYEIGKAEPVQVADVPMTREQQFLAANTHALLAVYLELRGGRR